MFICCQLVLLNKVELAKFVKKCVVPLLICSSRGVMDA